MKLFLALSLLIPFSSHADEFLKIGYIANQLHIVGNQAITVSSGIDQDGIKKTASVNIVDLDSFQVRSETHFPLGWNLYRAAIEENRMWISEWSQNNLYQVHLNTDLRGKSISPAPFFKTTTKSRGMESVVRVGGKTWVAYSNPKPDWSGYNPGVIVVLGDDAVSKQTLITEVPNPKNMIAKGGKVFVSVGDYSGVQRGQVLVLDPDKLPLDGGNVQLRQSGSLFHERYDLEGVPGSMYLDEKRNQLFVCDLEYGSGRNQKGRRFFRIDLSSGSVQSFRGKFNTCGSIVANEERVYVLNLNGGNTGSEKEHLYVYDRDSGRQLCAKTIYPGRIRQSIGFFPNEIKTYRKRGKDFLVLTLGGFFQGATVFPALLGKLPLDRNGLPRDCQ